MTSHPDVFAAVRGSGLMLGLKCVVPNGDVIKAGYDANVLAVPAAENVIRLLPALTITDEDIAEALTRLERAAVAVKSKDEMGQ